MCSYPVAMKNTEYDASTQIAQLRLSLDHVTPRVARVLAVPFEIRLDRLHLIFQAALGWSNSRLYMFESRGIFWGVPGSDAACYTVLPSGGSTLADLVVDAGASSFKYVYDFGDEWRCSVRLQALTMAAPRVFYPLLLAASGRTPPEDVGGPSGYEDYLMALCDPSHKRRSTYDKAYGLDFDPAVIDIAQIDFAISQLTTMPRPPRKLARSKLNRSSDISAETPPRTPKVNGAGANASPSRASKARPPKSRDV